MTVLHEILHQWFGSMVTTPWWDYAWLNEGICKYLNFYITDTVISRGLLPGVFWQGVLNLLFFLSPSKPKIEPDWELDNKFVENVHQRALAWDEYNDTHPLTYPLLTPAEIVDGFDTITLDKSAAVLRMLKYMVGYVNFRSSLNKFLSDFAWVLSLFTRMQCRPSINASRWLS